MSDTLLETQQKFDGFVANYDVARNKLVVNIKIVTDRIDKLKNSLPRSDAMDEYNAIEQYRKDNCRDIVNGDLKFARNAAANYFNSLLGDDSTKPNREWLGPVVDLLIEHYEAILGLSNSIARVRMPELLAAINNTPYIDTSLQTGINSVNDGSAFAPAHASLASMSNIVATLPPDIAAVQNARLSAQQSAITTAASNIGRDLGVAKANIALQNTMSLANTGLPISDDALNASAGPLAVLKDGPTALAQQHDTICATLISTASNFGVSIPSGLSAPDAAKVAGAGVAAFSASIPSKTVPDPSNPTGPSMPNPLYTTFIANPSNAAKLAHLGNLANNLTLPDPIAALASSASAALSSAISNIKTISTLRAISSPLPTSIVGALNNAVDYTKIQPTQIIASLVPKVTKPNIAPGPTTGS